MPYPNEHALRLMSPDRAHIRVRRTHGSGNATVKGTKIPASIDVIWYIIKTPDGEAPVAQALRFPIRRWTADQARKFIKDNKLGGTFEAAAPAQAAAPDQDGPEYSTIKSKLEEWFPVAAVGKFPQGDLTLDLFKQLVKSFKPKDHEPPLTQGHISGMDSGKPAMGWVTGVKIIGKRLFVKAKQIWDDFDKMVRDGRYKKRSIAIRHRNDGMPYLHHVAFLGATPPAVKGLPDIYMNPAGAYQDGGADKQIDNYPFDGEQGNHKQDGDNMPKEYTEKEIQELQDQAAKDAETKKDQEFKDKEEQLKKDAKEEGKKEAEQEYKNQQADAKAQLDHDRKMDEFCDLGIKEGWITPAQLKKGLKALLYSMVKPAEIKYQEGDGDKAKEITTDNLAVLQDVLKAYAAAPGEGVDDTDESTAKGGDYAAEKKKAEEIMKAAKDEGRTMTYGEALVQAREELGVKTEGEPAGAAS